MTISQYASLIAGFSGGTASTLVCHPLDLLKIRYSVNDATSLRPQYRSYFHAATCIIKAEGIRGLYQGLSPNLVAAPLSWGLYFHFYHQMRPHLDFIPDKFELRNLATGCLAGAVVAAITNPLWVAKTRLCLQYEGKTKKYRSLFHCLQRIAVDEGLRGLYKGFGPALFGTLHGGIQFTIYNFLKDRKCRNEKIPQGSQLPITDYFIFSAISKVLATSSTYPYQVVRARLQDHHTNYLSSKDVIMKTVKREGIGGLYKGMFLATLRQLPGGVVTYVVYEKVKQFIEDFDRMKADGPVDYHWGYSEKNGPDTWPGTCAEGFRQSPIDFAASELDITFLPRIHFIHYRRAGSVKAKNTGFSVTVSGFDAWGEYRPYIFGGGLEKYKLDHFHFHWAQDHLNGSEHTVGTLHYPAEVHFVHVKDGYNLQEALGQPDGIAVVGVLLTLGDDGRSLAKFDKNLRKVNETTDHAVIHGFICDTMLPMNTEAFYRYEGSLTTPGCQESVIWTVLADPVSITQEQLDTLRKIRSHVDIEHNSRPVQPLNRRKISFRPSTIVKSQLCGSGAISGKSIGLFLVSLIIVFFNSFF